MTNLLNYVELLLLFALFHRLAEAITSLEMTRAIFAYNREYDTCKGVTDETQGESKMAADQACDRAFRALDQLGLNICFGWRHAACRVVPGDEYRHYQCTCLISYCDDLSIRSGIITPFRNCAALIRQQEERAGFAIAPLPNFQKSRLQYNEALEAADFRRSYNYSSCHGGAGTSSGADRTGSSSSVFASGGAGFSGSVHTRDSVGSSRGESSGSIIYRGGRWTPTVRLPYECDECDRKFKSARALFNHKRNLHTVGDTHCYLCNFTYASRKSFMDHAWHRHPEIHAEERASQDLSAEAEAVMPYPCTFCRRRFTTDKSLRAHKKIHTTHYTKCPICNQILATRASLKRHMNIHHQGAAVPPPGPIIREHGSGHLVCDVCRNKFSSQNSLRQHRKSHTTLETYCMFCDKTLAAKNAYKTHMKRKHPEVATAEAEAEIEQFEDAHLEKCGKCGKRFKSPRGLKEHMAFHDGKTRCEKCNRTFPRTASLAAHKKKEHPK